MREGKGWEVLVQRWRRRRETAGSMGRCCRTSRRLAHNSPASRDIFRQLDRLCRGRCGLRSELPPRSQRRRGGRPAAWAVQRRRSRLAGSGHRVQWRQQPSLKWRRGKSAHLAGGRQGPGRGRARSRCDWGREQAHGLPLRRRRSGTDGGSKLPIFHGLRSHEILPSFGTLT
jgi:hypothetical protein